ncbi:hypothetical protein ONZ45_g14786 [Pleurotus djamor]|nr:hypothetical protein ONZ45_g14786 [Pleurotus djamor]
MLEPFVPKKFYDGTDIIVSKSIKTPSPSDTGYCICGDEPLYGYRGTIGRGAMVYAVRGSPLTRRPIFKSSIRYEDDDDSEEDEEYHEFPAECQEDDWNTELCAENVEENCRPNNANLNDHSTLNFDLRAEVDAYNVPAQEATDVPPS